MRAGDQAGGQVNEFKAMVRAMHEAGLEVILDVVFNHTAEGGEGGPSLCFRGLDNTAYYRLNRGARAGDHVMVGPRSVLVLRGQKRLRAGGELTWIIRGG